MKIRIELPGAEDWAFAYATYGNHGRQRFIKFYAAEGDLKWQKSYYVYERPELRGHGDSIYLSKEQDRYIREHLAELVECL